MMMTATLLAAILPTIPTHAFGDDAHVGKIKYVFDDAAVRQCAGNFGSPHIVMNRDGSKVFMIADCCAENACVQTASKGLGDYSKGLYSVMQVGDVDYEKGDVRWHSFTNVTQPYGGDPTNAGGLHAVFDREENRIVLFGTYKPSGDSRHSYNVTYSIRYANLNEDGALEGLTRPFDITRQLQHCSPDQTNMLVASAGSSAQATSGRLLVPAHDHSKHATIFYSDDGGSNWNCSNVFQGNEISVAEVPHKPGNIYINGRPENFHPHRSSYWSTDNGRTFNGSSKVRALVHPGKGEQRMREGNGCSGRLSHEL